MLAVMHSKLTSASASTATLAAIFSVFANRIMLLFVSFLPKMCPQLLQGSTFSLLMAADPAHSEVWRLSDADAGGSGESSRTRRVGHYQLMLKPSCSCRRFRPCC